LHGLMPEEKELRAIVRIAGTDCDGEQKLRVGLCKIRGVGFSFANALAKATGLPPDMKTGELTDEDVEKIEKVLRDPSGFNIPAWMTNRRNDPSTGITSQLVGSDIDIAIRSDLERMRRTSSWKGIRHSLGLKVRGQHTKTTGRTGKTVGVSKKALLESSREAAAAAEKK
jgi:small subunit ribosomal protein S13